MKRLTQEEELLIAIFDGPLRPLTEEDQMIQDGVTSRYEERRRIRLEGYAEVLELSFEEVAQLEKKSVYRLVERVAHAKMTKGCLC